MSILNKIISDKRFHEAGMLVEIFEQISEIMEDEEHTIKSIAEKLEVSTEQVSQWLDVKEHTEVKVVADILWAMGLRFTGFISEKI